MPTEVAPKGVRVPEGVSRLLRDLIHDRTGLFFEDTRMDGLLEKLEPLAHNRGCRSFLEYYYALKDGEAEWQNAWEALSVQETYFWREIDQVRSLVDVIVPQYFSTPGAETLRQKIADEGQVAVLGCRCERTLLLQVEAELTLQSLRWCRHWRDRRRNHPLPYQQIP
jgi:hypothetical protein